MDTRVGETQQRASGVEEEIVKAVSLFHKTVIPGEPAPWFDRLTVLSRVEGESRKRVENKTILDPPTPLAGDDELPNALCRFRFSLRAMIGVGGRVQKYG